MESWVRNLQLVIPQVEPLDELKCGLCYIILITKSPWILKYVLWYCLSDWFTLCRFLHMHLMHHFLWDTWIERNSSCWSQWHKNWALSMTLDCSMCFLLRASVRVPNFSFFLSFFIFFSFFSSRNCILNYMHFLLTDG